MRSLLIAPGDDDAKLEAALESQADAVVIDLVVGPGARAAARANAARLLAKAPTLAPALMVRVNPLGDAGTDLDLEAIVRFAPAAIVLPHALRAASVQLLSVKLAVQEAVSELADGVTGILAVADTAEAFVNIASFRGASARFVGLGWDAEALRADVGAATLRDGAGGYLSPYRLARDMTLLAAAAAAVSPIDAAFAGADLDALRAEAIAARGDGFCGKFVLDAAQARIVHEAFGD